MLTELVNTLVTALGQNEANATPGILPGIPLANFKGEEGLPPQEGGDAVVGEVQADTDVRRRRVWHRRRTRRKN